MHSNVHRTSRPPEGFPPQLRLARISGVLYLLIALLGMFAPTVLQGLVVSGDAAVTADNIRNALGLFGTSLAAWILLVVSDAAVAITLYLLLEPVSRTLSLLAAAFRLIYAGIVGASLPNLYQAFSLLTRADQQMVQQREILALSSLDMFGAAFLLALVFFGVHVTALGWLLYRSGYVPRPLSGVLIAGGLGYIVHTLGTFFQPESGLASAVLLLPALVGELGLTVWFLVKGIRVPPEPPADGFVSPSAISATQSVVIAGGRTD